MVEERTPVTDPGEIWIHGRPYRVKDNVSYELSNIFARAVNQGDPRPNDHPTHTTSIQRDWSGGGLVRDANPASDKGRFHKSTLETQYPGVIALPPATVEHPSPGGQDITPWVIGDFNGRLHLAWGESLFTLDQVNGTYTFVGDMPGTATGEGIVYREEGGTTHGLYMFIPLHNGYCTVNTDGVIQAGTDIGRVVEFEVWDFKVYKLMTDGTLWYATIRPTLASDWTYTGAIPDGSTPRRLLRFMDKQGNPCLFAVTDGTTWKHDMANNIFHADDLEYPRHPDQGRAAINNRGEVWTSVGVGIHRYDNNTISPQGLDARSGLDPNFKGLIVDFEKTYNGLYALIEGRKVIQDSLTDTARLQSGPKNSFSMSPSTSDNLIQMWNGFGWHYRWHGSGDAPNNIKLSNVQNVYRIYWGANGRLYSQMMPRVYFNPDDPDTAGYPFALSGEHESSWDNWGWEGQDKIMKAIEFETDRMKGDASIEVYYKIDDESHPWVYVDTVTTNGEHRFFLGIDPDEPELRGGRPKFKGVRHERYKLLFVMRRDPNMPETSPIIKWHSVLARRWLRPQRIWRPQLVLNEKLKDWPVQKQLDHLEECARIQEAIVLQHQDDQYLVELVMLGAVQRTGKNKESIVNVTLMEAYDLDLDDTA